jgi:hypothetical protein
MEPMSLAEYGCVVELKLCGDPGRKQIGGLCRLVEVRCAAEQ